MLAPVSSLPPAAGRVVEAAARRGVEIDVVVFDQSTHTAEAAAAAVGAEVGQIVKSLVFVVPHDEGDLRPYIVLASGANMVDLARLAAVTGESRIRRATADEARALTGYTIGGIPPFGHDQALRTVMDPDLGRYRTVWAAAGTPNAVFALAPEALRRLSNATVAPIAALPAASGLNARGAPATG
jgi:Cys-tRNA(Pro) deacylase